MERNRTAAVALARHGLHVQVLGGGHLPQRALPWLAGPGLSVQLVARSFAAQHATPEQRHGIPQRMVRPLRHRFSRTTMLTPGVPEAVFARLHALQPTAVRRWGSMSVEGMLSHLDGAYRGMLQAGVFAPSGNAWVGRVLVRPAALHVPLRWARGLPTVPELDVRKNGRLPGTFKAERAHAVQAMTLFLSHRDWDGLQHPMMGSLNEWEWMRWAWLHTDHHLRQFSA